MNAPHFLLHTETHNDPSGGRWRFSLRRATGRVILEAADVEPDLAGPRLELLVAVRGLEAVECPGRVLLTTPSNYVRRGIEYGLDSWRQNEWTWEWFGQMVPVKNRDLWQRLDHALRFHDVHCRQWRIDSAHAKRQPGRGEPESIIEPATQLVTAPAVVVATPASRRWTQSRLQGQRWLADQADAWRLRAAQLAAGLLPQPWLK